jgi:putative membrane protein
MSIRQFSRISSLAVLSLAGIAALAQMPAGGGGMQQSSPNQQQPATNQPGGPGNPNTGMPSDQQPAPSVADQAFLEDTLQADVTQVQMSQLAQQKSTSDDVKQFSQQIVQLHTQLDNQLKPLAKQLEVSAPQKPSKKEKQEIDKLEALSGPDFDAAYLQAMAKEQQHTLKEFKSEESTQNPMIQKATKIDEPVLTQQLQVLQNLAQTHNIPLESK